MAGDVQHRDREITDGEARAIGEELVEIGAVAVEIAADVEGCPEGFLHGDDVLADGDLAAKACLQIGRGREVIGVGVGFEQPIHLQIMRRDMGDYGIGRGGGGAARGGIVVEHAVDDGGAAGEGIVDDIGHGVGGRVEKGLDYRAGAGPFMELGGLDLGCCCREGGVLGIVGHFGSSIYRLHELCKSVGDLRQGPFAGIGPSYESDL